MVERLEEARGRLTAMAMNQNHPLVIYDPPPRILLFMPSRSSRISITPIVKDYRSRQLSSAQRIQDGDHRFNERQLSDML